MWFSWSYLLRFEFRFSGSTRFAKLSCHRSKAFSVPKSRHEFLEYFLKRSGRGKMVRRAGGASSVRSGTSVATREQESGKAP